MAMAFVCLSTMAYQQHQRRVRWRKSLRTGDWVYWPMGRMYLQIKRWSHNENIFYGENENGVTFQVHTYEVEPERSLA